MKLILSVILFSSLTCTSFSQSDFIRIEANKTLGVFSFLETSSAQLGTSRSFRNYIAEAAGDDEDFSELIKAYSELNLDYAIKREDFPEKGSLKLP